VGEGGGHLLHWALEACYDIALKPVKVTSESFLGPKWHSPDGSMLFNRAKMSRFPGPNPLPLAPVMYLPASKALRMGGINHRSINTYFAGEIGVTC
jgi:hypothetical protein